MNNKSENFDQKMDKLDKEYEEQYCDSQNVRRIEELNVQISALLGETNLNLLREYTERVISQYHQNPGWFYKRGVEDATQLAFEQIMTNIDK